MTKGQRAMAVAKIYPETEQGKQSTSVKITEVSSGYLSHARTVLQFAPDLADGVLTGSTSLDAAYKTARKSAALERHSPRPLAAVEKQM